MASVTFHFTENSVVILYGMVYYNSHRDTYTSFQDGGKKMLYSEFVEGTGCKDNEHNYNLYKELELIYMNSDCTKAHIYEMGKKLADNSKSEAELKFEADINAEMAVIKEQMESNKHWIAYYKEQKNYDKSVGDKYWEKEHRRMERYYTDENKRLRNRMATLKWLLVA